MRSSSFLKYTLSALVVSMLTAIALLQPHWGMMDDYGMIQDCKNISTDGLWANWTRNIVGDLGWGMVRPFFPAMAAGLYCFSFGQAWVTFVLNAVFVILALALLGRALLKSHSIPGFNARNFQVAFILGTLAFFRFHDFFLHPSLQEKLVLLAGAGCLFFFSKSALKFSFRFCASSFILLSIGFCTKAQFLIFIPGILILLVRRNASPAVLAWILGCSAIGTWILKTVAAQGIYTGRYGMEHFFSNLLTPWALILALGAILSFAIEWRVLTDRNWRAQIGALFPASFFIAYLAIFAPWQIGDTYLLAIVGPFFAFAALSAAGCLWQRGYKKIRPFAAVSLALLACLVTAYRTLRNYGRLHDLGKILTSEQVKVLEPTALVVPCVEGAVAVQWYLKNLYGNSTLQVFDSVENATRSGKRPELLLSDSAICPLQSPIGSIVPLSKPLFANSFVLYRIE